MKSFKIAAFAVCAAVTMAFASCSDDDDNNKTTAIKFNPAVATVTVGSTQKVLMAGGKGAYTAKSGDEKTTTVSVVKDTVFVKGVKAGKTIVIVKDTVNVSGILNVTVYDALTLSKATTSLATGKEEVVTVSGGTSPYTATSKDARIATATVKDAKLTVKGVAEGSTTVTVADKNKNTATLTVTVTK